MGTKFGLCVLGISLLSSGLLPSALAVENPASQTIPKVQNSKEKEKIAPDINDFVYKPEDTRDPFEAVLLNKAQKARGAGTVQTKKEQADRTGYELEALKLVGVLRSDKGMMAMMEDSQGKGVFFKKGDPLNNRIGMWVADISNDEVVFAYKLKGEIKKVVVDLPNKR